MSDRKTDETGDEEKSAREGSSSRTEPEPAAVTLLRRELGTDLRDYVTDRGEDTVVVSAGRVVEALGLLRENADPQILLDFLMDITAYDRIKLDAPSAERFAVVYHLYNLATRNRLRVRTHLPAEDPHLPSATGLWPAADWLEREVFDLYGIVFDGHPDLRRLLMPDDYDGHPLRKDYPLRGRGERMELQGISGLPPAIDPAELQAPRPFRSTAAAADDDVAPEGRAAPSSRHLGALYTASATGFAGAESGTPEGVIGEPGLEEDRLEEFRRGRITLTQEEGMPSDRMILNFGPQHPATHGTLRVIMELDGELVIQAVPEIGFLHSGFEKLAEHRRYDDFITITDRMNYLSPMNNNFGYALAMEKLLGVEAPPRAQYIRVILSELSRVFDHQVCIGMQAVDLGAYTAFLYLFRDKEIIYDILEAVTGARFTISYCRAGGVARDVPDDFTDMVKTYLKVAHKAIDDTSSLLDKNRIWLQRTRGVGIITKEDAIAYGVTGPSLRASGIAHDLRRAEPYSSYDQFEFDIPVGENGDVYDRYLVRMEEMRQSLRIVEQALARMPGGPVMTEDDRVGLPPKDKVYTSIEGLIFHFKQIMDGHGFNPPPGEVYAYSEAPNGELGFFLVSDGGNRPYRVRVRPPSLLNYQIFPHVMKGRLLSDAVAILASLNVIAGELDR